MNDNTRRNNGTKADRNRKQRFSMGALLFWMILLCFVASPSVSLFAAKSVDIAIVGPMIGTSNAVGIQYKVGVTAALNTLPDGLLLGRKVTMTLHDDSCNASIAENVAKKIVEKPPAVVIGHSCSGATIAGAPIYAEKGILQITPASTNPLITEMGIPTIFRMIGRDDAQGTMAAHRISGLHRDQRIGVLYFPSKYSTGLSKTAISAMKALGISPVLQIEARASLPSYAEEIDTLMGHDIEVLYIAGGGGLDNGIFLREARQLGASFHCIGADTLISDDFLKAAGSAAEGVPFTFPPEAVKRPSAAPAIQAIHAMGRDPEGYTLLAYAAIEVWIEAVKRANSFESPKVAHALRQAPISTILGKISFDDKGDVITPYPPFQWFTWKDGNRVPME